MSVALRIATCRQLPEPDPDEELLLTALRARGIDARMAAWNDPTEDWAAPVPTVIRSTWDYFHEVPRFVSWAETAGAAAPMWNGPGIVRWNVHKGYLNELRRRGHAVVPTELVPRGWQGSLARLCAMRGWRDIVVKPAASAASFGTARFADPGTEAAARHFAARVHAGDTLVQPYVPSVEAYGERSIVWVDGALTHAVRKTPRFGGEDEQVSMALPIAADERHAAEAVLAPWTGELLYARVDLARDVDGTLMVMELELIEPSLFLAQHPPALERLVAGLARRLA
jgi:hypothetical protein